MTTEEKRAYNRERQREWRRNHPEYKEKAKARQQQQSAKMTDEERQQRKAIIKEQKRKWAAEHRELLNRYSMEAYARQFNCVIVPNTPEVLAALETINEECARIAEKVRARQTKETIDNAVKEPIDNAVNAAIPIAKQAADVASEARDKIAETINQLGESALQPPAGIGNETVVTSVEIDDAFVMLASSITSGELVNLTIATA